MPSGGILSDETARFLSDWINELSKRMDIVQSQIGRTAAQRDDFFVGFPNELIPKATLGVGNELTMDPKLGKIYRFKDGSATQMELLTDDHNIYNANLDLDIPATKPVFLHREWYTGRFFATGVAPGGSGGGGLSDLCSGLSAVTGYDAGKTQVFGHVAGTCQMLDVKGGCPP